MKHLTVVYTINDEAAFGPEFDRITNHFKASKDEPWAVTAISRGHEMHRLDMINDAVFEEKEHLVLDLIQLANPGDFDDFEHFLRVHEGGAQ